MRTRSKKKHGKPASEPAVQVHEPVGEHAAWVNRVNRFLHTLKLPAHVRIVILVSSYHAEEGGDEQIAFVASKTIGTHFDCLLHRASSLFGDSDDEADRTATRH